MTNVINKEKISIHIARLKREGTTFEIDVDPDAAIAFKKGMRDVRDVIKVETIFFDVKKGLRASQERLQAVFNSIDPLVISEEILRKGEIQVTAEHRKAERDEKLKKIVGIIHANAIDPRTNAPHPPARIEAAMDQGKIRIDESKNAEEQIQTIVAQLRPIIPIKFEIKEVEVHILAEHAHKGFGNIKKQGKILHETWNNDGSWTGIVEIPGGLYDEFCDMLNSLTHGRSQCKVVKTR